MATKKRNSKMTKRKAAAVRKQVNGYWSKLSRDGKLVNLHMMLGDAREAGESKALIAKLEKQLWDVSLGGE